MSIVIAIGAIFVLVVVHELGHFLLAKKFDVEAQEFGIGLPFTPAIFKKKIGETVYSFYPLLIGAFVRLKGEEHDDQDPRTDRCQSSGLRHRNSPVSGNTPIAPDCRRRPARSAATSLAE